MRIVFLCEDWECPYPDVVIYDPADDNIVCACGRVMWGHHLNEEVKLGKFWEKVVLEVDGKTYKCTASRGHEGDSPFSVSVHDQHGRVIASSCEYMSWSDQIRRMIRRGEI